MTQWSELEMASDTDVDETLDWIEAFESVVRSAGPLRAKFLLDAVERHAKTTGTLEDLPPFQPYKNSIALNRQPQFPGDVDIEERLTALVRWNALAMVVKANSAYGELGGHISSYASAAEIFEVGFNHFLRLETSPTLCSSSRIRRPVSMPEPFLRGAFRSSGWRTIDRKRAVMG